MFRFVMMDQQRVLPSRCGAGQTAGMSRDDPSSRFDVAAQVPYFAHGDNAGHHWLLGLPGPVDRVLARVVPGRGVQRFELVPAGGDWLEDPARNAVAIAANKEADARGVGVDLRLESGLSTDTGLRREAAFVAAAAAVAAACGDPTAQHTMIDQHTVVEGASQLVVQATIHGRAGPAPDWKAAAVVFADTKAEPEDFAAAIRAGLDCGASEVLHLAPSTVLAGCADSAAANRSREAIIEAFAHRGVWSRGRAGDLKGRHLQISRLHER